MSAVQQAMRPAKARRAWPRVLLTGLVLWAATVIVTFLTSNTNLIPTIVLLGSFLVPVTFVVWAFEHTVTREVGIQTVFSTFVVGGVLGVLGASVFETYLLRPSLWLYAGVGLIEEGVKLLALAWVARKVQPKTLQSGLLLGASVGFGFAAFESAGYALNALFTVHGLSLINVVETELLRGLLAPFGHGLWTAITGGVLFAVSRNGRYRVTGSLILTYLGVSLLHALWDSMHGIALLLTLVLTGTPYQFSLLERGQLPQVTEAQVNLFTTLSWAGLIVVALIGLGWLLALSRKAVRGPSRRPPTGPYTGPPPNIGPAPNIGSPGGPYPQPPTGQVPPAR